MEATVAVFEAGKRLVIEEPMCGRTLGNGG
jgi:hypothetical protein